MHAQRRTSRAEPKWSVRHEVTTSATTVNAIWMTTSVMGSMAARRTILLRIIMPQLHAMKKTHDATRATV